MNTASNAGNEQTALLNCRVNLRIKQLAEAAATMQGQSLTDFTETALKEKADAVLEQVHKIQISERDFERFFEAINADIPPTAELIAAMREFERQRGLEPKENW